MKLFSRHGRRCPVTAAIAGALIVALTVAFAGCRSRTPAQPATSPTLHPISVRPTAKSSPAMPGECPDPTIAAATAPTNLLKTCDISRTPTTAYTLRPGGGGVTPDACRVSQIRWLWVWRGGDDRRCLTSRIPRLHLFSRGHPNRVPPRRGCSRSARNPCAGRFLAARSPLTRLRNKPMPSSSC